MKCDEGKPSCQRCVKAGRRCEGYTTLPEPVSTPHGHKFVHYVEPAGITLSRSPSPLSDINTHSLRSLDFYINATALKLGEPFGIDLFSKDLSCFMQYDAAVRHSTIALAAFHENFLHPTDSVTNHQRRLLALDHYGQSIQNVVELNRNGRENATLTTLITCLIYCALESIQGHFNSAMKHIISGIQVLAEQEHNLLEQEGLGLGVSTGFIDKMRLLFTCLGTQAMAIEDACVDPVAVEYLQKTAAEHVSYTFVSTKQALADLTHLINDCIRYLTWSESYYNDPEFPNAALVSTGEKLDRRFEEWTRTYHQLLARSQNQNRTPSEHDALLVLRVNQLLIRIILEFKYDRGQMLYDQMLGCFQTIISTCEDLLASEAQQRARSERSPPSSSGSASSQNSFGLTLGIVPALFFTCTRCRDSQTRHRALDILKSNRRRESVWDSQIVAVVAERMIQLEEEKAARYWQEQGSSSSAVRRTQQEGTTDLTISSAQDVPEEARISIVHVDFLGSENSVQVSLLKMWGTERHEQVIVWDE